MCLTIRYKIPSDTIRLRVCLISENNMKINIQVEVDTESEQDLTTIEELIAMLKTIADNHEWEE